MPFQWDNEKDITNPVLHEGVTFEEAATVFDDPLLADIYDPRHSDNEHRFFALGVSSQGRLLIVSYTDRDGDIRIISARKAERPERKKYADGTISDRY